MKRYLPIILSIALIVVLIFFVSEKKTSKHAPKTEQIDLGNFAPKLTCSRAPAFLRKLKIPQPVVIDLSQKRYKGIALLHGKNFKKTLHPKQWEQYEHFSTYALDRDGNIYLIPTPFISIRPTTFNLQKNIYKLDTKSGKLSTWMTIDEVKPSSQNPYGLNAIVYDCDDNTLWVASIDESDYATQRGYIYHIDLKTKTILQKIDGFDVLSMAIINGDGGKFLLAGSARDNGLYAFSFANKRISTKPHKILEIPNPNDHIRKIRIKSSNMLELETIPFTYSMIASTSKHDRTHYGAKWHPKQKYWEVRSNHK